jgi:cell division protein FtsQ
MTTTLPQRAAGDPPDTERRPGRLKLGLIAALVVGLVAVGAWTVAFSSVLGAKTITVLGTRTLTVAQVRAAAHIAPGAPLIRLNQGQVTRRVEALPDVASAQIRLRYPHTVIITVTERVAIGYVSAGSAFALVDHSGHQFRTVATIPAGLPHFVVAAGASVQAVGAAMASVAAALSGTPVLAQLSLIQAADPEAITLVLRDGRTVLWGGAERSADKAHILAALLARPGRTFDISDPDQVVAR